MTLTEEMIAKVQPNPGKKKKQFPQPKPIRMPLTMIEKTSHNKGLAVKPKHLGKSLCRLQSFLCKDN